MIVLARGCCGGRLAFPELKDTTLNHLERAGRLLLSGLCLVDGIDCCTGLLNIDGHFCVLVTAFDAVFLLVIANTAVFIVVVVVVVVSAIFEQYYR